MSKDLNPSQQYGFNQHTEEAKPADMVQVEQSKAIQEVQAAYIIAKKYPRDEHKSFAKIMQACTRPFLAEQAIYAYPRGKEVVTGPSIRLAEVLAQCWGNISTGIVEISQEKGRSLVKAFAIDRETNFEESKIFYVEHKRYTTGGTYVLTNPRDIYEHIANQGARRKRACILAVIPGDVSEAAEYACKKTMASGKEPLADRIRKLITAYQGEFGVSVEQIEKRLGHKLDAIIEAELVTLRAMYKSLKDGMAKREEFFDFGQPANSTATDDLNEALKQKGAKTPPAPPATTPATAEAAAPKTELDQGWEDFAKEGEPNASA